VAHQRHSKPLGLAPKIRDSGSGSGSTLTQAGESLPVRLKEPQNRENAAVPLLAGNTKSKFPL